MGQSWVCVNLDKREFLNPHKLASLSGLWSQLSDWPGPSTALVILLAAMPEPRGSGDLSLHVSPEYNELASQVIGRWAGDRVAFVGDYASDSDLPKQFHASTLCSRCFGGGRKSQRYRDITDAVCCILEYELSGRFGGEGVRSWQRLQAGVGVVPQLNIPPLLDDGALPEKPKRRLRKRETGAAVTPKPPATYPVVRRIAPTRRQEAQR